MPTYHVIVIHRERIVFEVEADSESQAEETYASDGVELTDHGSILAAEINSVRLVDE